MLRLRRESWGSQPLRPRREGWSSVNLGVVQGFFMPSWRTYRPSCIGKGAMFSRTFGHFEGIGLPCLCFHFSAMSRPKRQYASSKVGFMVVFGFVFSDTV